VRDLVGEFANELLSCAWRHQITLDNRVLLETVTMQAIAGSGGLDEALVLPMLIILPGTLLGVIGGLCGAIARAAGGGRASAH